MIHDPYLSPEEAAIADAAASLRKLQSLIAEAELLRLEKKQLHKDLGDADEELAEDIDCRLREIKSEELSLHREGSFLQSVLRVP